MRKLALALIAIFALFSLGGCSDSGFMKDKDIKDIDIITGTIEFSFTNIDDPNVTDRYTIEFELYYKEAPITVTNFVKLVKEEFYKDTYCNKFSMAEGSEYIVADAYIEEDEIKKQKSIDYYIKGEFKSNGWERNDIEHTYGTMSMMRPSGYDSAGFEFMICLDSEGFKGRDGEYAAFGKLKDIDSTFFSDLKRMNAISLYEYEFKVVSITIDGDIDLGEPLTIKK
jgi:peptidyl-prolyl cis-trans isomerase B (cyclophilin B)